MDEEPLRTDDAYRFVWLRSFHNPVSVRIQASGGKATLVAIELDSPGGRGPGSIERRTERGLGQGEWSSLIAGLGPATFWDAPTELPHDMNMDGADWIMEGRRQGVYHVVARNNPAAGPFRAAGEAFLKAAKFSFPADETY